VIYRRGSRKLFVILPLVILAAAVLGFAVMNLWNFVVPAVFGGRIITFWQGLGLLVLSRILFGGFFRRGGFGDRQRARRAIWERMTPEEREKFRAGMRHRCGGRGPNEEGSAPA
jgi:hypothetical protein